MPAGALLRDFRYAARILRHSPAFTVIAVATLALGIGANTAIFTVVDELLLRPLPYPQPDRLALVATEYQANGKQDLQASEDGRAWQAARDGVPAVETAVYSDGSGGVNLALQSASGTRPLYVMQQRVGAGFFRVLGVPPFIGREFNAGEDRAGGPAAVVLSNELWRRFFNSDPAAIGRRITLRGEPYTIVGIMPPGFHTNAVDAELWTPLRPSTGGEGGGTNYRVLCRLRPGHTWSEANAELELAGRPVLAARGIPKRVHVRLTFTPLQRGITEQIRQPLLILWAAVAVVLLIACMNIAGLLLARARSRSREFATRLALGGGRSALIRQLLAESFLIAAAGGAFGALLGYGGLAVLKNLGAETFPALETAALDTRALAITAALSLATAILFGLAPALSATRSDIRSALAEGSRAVAGDSRHWPRRVLVVTEVALGVVLLVGAGLLIRTFQHLTSLPPGFDGTHVITGKISLQDARYATPEAVTRLFDESLRRIRELPGVESAAVVLGLPYERLLNEGFAFSAGDEQQHITDLAYATPEFFRTLRIPLLRGRVLAESDTAASNPVAVVNEAFVKRYFASSAPLGRNIWLSGAGREIVGVIGNTQQQPGWGGGGPLARHATVYIPVTQTSPAFLKLVHTWFSPEWVVRTSRPSGVIMRGMQQAVETVDPTLPFASFRTLDDVRSDSLRFQRFLSTLLSAMAALALVLAAVGLYGLIAQSVVERTHELGIRLALGATVPQAAKAVVLPGITLACVGAVIGVALALVSTHFLRHFLWGVGPTDPATFAVVAALAIAVAVFASAIPALRLLRLDPAETLRAE